MSNGERITRRGLVGAALAGSLGLAAASLTTGCAPKGAKDSGDSRSWEQESDVVVVGGGAAGCAAALEAADAGASVLLLEKGSASGGDSAICDGILGGAGTRLATAQGIEVGADQVYDWFMANPDWYGSKDPEVVRVNADRGGETIDWLQDLGVPFEAKVGPRMSYTDLPVIHQVDGKGAAMMKVLVAAAESKGVKTTTNTPATRLIMDDQGRVVGVEAARQSKALRFKANKGVVLATGGFGSSTAMLSTLNAECANVRPAMNPNSTGDGLAMSMASGVLTSRVANIPLLNSLAGVESKSVVNLNYSERLHGLWLDAEARRFYNEETPYENPNGHRAIMRKQNEQGKQVIVLLSQNPDLDALLASRPLEWAKADGVEEIAGMVGLDAAKLKATVERFNGFCAAGTDEDFGRPADSLVPMNGPFYAAPVTVSCGAVTVGGVKINAKAQALKLGLASGGDQATQVVPGLYAAGSVCEWNCAAGATVLSALTIGRVAGQNVAKEEAAS